MTKHILTALLFCAFTTSAGAAARVGEPAPDFSGVDTAGNTHSLADYRGQLVVLEWTNHDCPFVRKHYDAGNMQAQQREATAQGAVWLSVISSAPGKQGHVSATEADRLTSERSAAPTAVLLDESGAIGRAYGARTTPHMYLVDRDGTLVYMGGIDSVPSSNPADIDKARQHLRIALAEVTQGKAVSEPVTRAYGCSVKY
jgi:peroxiredoxin